VLASITIMMPLPIFFSGSLTVAPEDAKASKPVK
jgi:hypothetical protein